MLEDIKNMFDQYSLNISTAELIMFFLIIFFTLTLRKLALYIFEKKLVGIAEKTETKIDDMLVAAFKSPLGYFIVVCGIYISIASLHLPEQIGIFDIVWAHHFFFTLAFTFVALLLMLNLIDIVAYCMHQVTLKTETKLDEQLVPLVIKSLKVVVVMLTVLFLIQNLGGNVTSLLAGLGIGGLALALAAQDTVSNIFGSVTVFSDRSFHIGDWIRVNGVEGTVEDVGLRSTRIRRFDQALVTVPNSRFIKSEIVNFTRMKKRRIKFNLGVSYKTSRKQMEEVVEGINRIIKEDSGFDHNFHMVHFTEFGAYSLDIFIYCFTKTTVWNEFLVVRERFNLQIMQLLEELGVEIAYPSQTIFVEETEET
ncbi:MAG: Small-conductance mechanosensitive channel MscMJ [Candidatus Methanogaster sp.]|nr:MAG: Small-conductance mechanosensitive channel MscMJ [ANME-2 cluster archaeon]